MKQCIYAGPSWAASSYPDDQELTTNLLKEWKLSAIITAKKADSNLRQIEQIKKLDSNLPVVFLYCEPLGDLETITGLTFRNFVESENWEEIWYQCNTACLTSIDNLTNPTALIGSHSDIDVSKTSSFIVESSWQKWIAERAGMIINNGNIAVTPTDGGNYSLTRCWGAEVVHRYLHNNPDVKPHSSLLDAIWDMYFFWEKLQRRNWFFEVHPNYLANVEFANYTKDIVTDFINNH